MTTEEKKDTNSLGALLVGLLLVACALVLAPGIAAVNIVCEVARLSLDVGQMWTFSTIFSLAVIISLRLFCKEWSKALLIWLAACVITAGVTAVANWGFHAEWPQRFIQRMIPEQTQD